MKTCFYEEQNKSHIVPVGKMISWKLLFITLRFSSFYNFLSVLAWYWSGYLKVSKPKNGNKNRALGVNKQRVFLCYKWNTLVLIVTYTYIP